MTLRGATGAYTSTPLLAGTTFGAEMRASNPLGTSRWSERLVAMTPMPTKAPSRPPAPLVETSGLSCDVRVTVRLPAARSDECAGAEQVELQTLAAGSTSWRTLVVRSTETVLAVKAPTDVMAGKAHRFRVVGTNRVGAGLPGEASVIAIGGLPLDNLAPPVVHATSSSSFTVALPAVRAPCLENLGWTILGRVGPQGWTVFGTGVQGASVAVEQLRCPPQGCEFKLRPDVTAFSGAIETPSVFVANAQLGQLEEFEVRVEIRLHGSSWNSLLRSQLRQELKTWLRLRDEPEVLESHVNMHADDLSVVVDLPGASATAAAQKLANMLADGTPAPGGGALKRVQRSAGVLQQDASGKWRPLPPQPLDPDDFFSWGPISISIAALLVLGVCVRLVIVVLAAWRRCRLLRGSVPLAMSEEDAEEEEDRLGGAKRPATRTVDLNQLLNDDDFPA